MHPRPGLFSPSRRSALLAVAALAVVLSHVAVARGELNKRRLKINHYLAKAQEVYEAASRNEDVGWQTAIDYYRRALALEPINMGTYYNYACCCALNGDKQEALSALKKSIEYGWDDPAWIARDEDLQSLHGDAQLEQLQAEATKVRDEDVFVYVPDSVQRDKPAPLLVALHGGGDNPREFAAYWKDVAAERGVVVAAPRGPLRVAQGGYSWQLLSNPRLLDDAAAEQAVDRAIARAHQACKIDEKKIILGGFDQGGELAVKLVEKHPDRFAGAVTVASTYRPELGGDWKAAAAQSVRLFLICGKLDGVAEPRNVDLKNELESVGIKVKLNDLEATGHEIPGDYANLLRAGLQFVL